VKILTVVGNRPQFVKAAAVSAPLRAAHEELLVHTGLWRRATIEDRVPLVSSTTLADKIGGAIITFWNFIVMAAATIGVIYFVGNKDFAGFLTMFLIIFVTTGIGNGSTYRMIPSIFREENLRKARGTGEAGRALALKTASIESGAALGFIGAIGACGGYLIPSGFGKSIAITGGPQLALEIYLAFYAVCLGLTWWHYLRRSPAASSVASLAEARV